MKTQKTVLVIEDEKSLRDAIVEILLVKDIIPLTAKNGKEGIEMALLKRPDLILLDIIMPEMDGITALKKIRGDEWGVGVPIVILTNLSENGGETAYGATHYLVKSNCKIHDIADKIEKILNV